MSLDNVSEVGRFIANPFLIVWENILNFIPGLLLGILIAILGYIVGKIIGTFVKLGLKKFGLDDWIEKLGQQKVIGHMSASYILGGMTKWYIFALFLVPAISMIELRGVSTILETVVFFIPDLLVAILIVLAGILIADIVGSKLSHAHKITWIKYTSPVVKFFIIVFFIDAALSHIGIIISLAQNTFLLILGGVILALALIVGIAGGFALRKEAQQLVIKLKKKLK